MKKIFILFVFILMSLGINAQNNAIKTGPVALAFGNANIAFEHQFADKMSFLLKGSYLYGFKVGDDRVDGYSVGAGFRYYLKQKKNLAGFYVQPQAKYSSVGYINVAAILGYQFRWDGGFVLDLGVGPSKYIVVGDGESLTVPLIWPVMTLAIGYAF